MTDPAPRSLPDKPKRRVWKRVLWFGIALIGTIAIVALLLPTLLSFGPGRALLLGRIESALGATVTVDSLSLSWSGRGALRELEVTIPGDAVPLLKADEATVVTSLAGLFSRHFDVRLAIVKPEIHLIRAADGSFNFDKLAMRATKNAPSEKPALAVSGESTAAQGKPFDVKLDLVVTDGAVTLQDDELHKTSKLRGVQITAQNEKPNDPIHYSVKVRVPQAGEDGSLESSGTIEVRELAAAKSSFDLDQLRANGELTASNVELGPWRSLATRFAQVGDCQGTIGARLKASIAGRSKFESSGTLELEGLRVDVGKGRPAIREEHLSLATDIAIDLADDEISVRKLALRSTPATIDAKGSIHRFRSQPSGDFEGTAAVDLAKLLECAPAAFPSDLQATGNVRVEARLGEDAGTPRFSFSAGVAGLDLRGGPLAQPITEQNVEAEIVARFLREASRIGIDRATVTTSFASVKATGSVGGDGFRQVDLATEVHADLANACDRAAGALPQGLRAAGAVDSTLRIVDDGHTASIVGAARVSGLHVEGGPLSAPVDQAAISLDLDVGAERSGAAFDAIHVRKGEFVSSVATVSAKGDVTALASQPRADFKATITGDLGRARAELGAFFPATTELAGQIKTELVASDDGKGATTLHLHGGLTDFVMRSASDPSTAHAPGASLSWTASARYDRGADSLDVSNGALNTTFGDVRFGAQIAALRSSGDASARTIDARAVLGMDLAKANAALGAWLPPGLELAGTVSGEIDAHAAGATSRATAHVDAKDVMARGGGLTAPVTEPRASLDFEGEYDSRADRLNVSKGELSFSGAKLVATGSASKIRSALEGEASIALSADLAAAAERLRGFLPAGQELGGSVSASFTAKENGGRTTLAGSAKVQDLRASGGGLAAPVEEKESKLDVDVSYDRVKQALDVAALDLHASFAEAHAKGKVEGLSTRPRADFQSQFHVDLRSASERFGALLPQGLALAGLADARFQATSDAAGTKFQATATTTNLSASGGPLASPFAEPKMDVDVRGTFVDADDRLVLESAKAMSSFATIQGTGKIDRFSRSRDLTSDFTLRADLPVAAARLAAFLPAGTKLEGTTEGTASIGGSLALGTVIALYGRADLKGGVATVGSVRTALDRAVIRLENGVATLTDASANVNGGDVKTRASMDLSKETRPFQATIVATDVALSGDIRSALQYAIPLFAQAPDAVAEASGLASGTLDIAGSLAAMPRTLAGTGTVRLSKGEIAASPVVTGMLADFGGPAQLSFESATADFSIRNERVESRNVKFNGKEASLGLEGSVGFDQTLDYRVDARFVSSFLSKADRSRVGPYLDLLSGDDGVALPIAIRGTLTHPNVKLEFDRLLQDPAALAKRALDLAGKKKDSGGTGSPSGKPDPEDLVKKGLEGLLGGNKKRPRDDDSKAAHSSSALDALWPQFVDAKRGRSAYGALAADAEARRTFSDWLAAPDPPAASREARLAAALNRYDVAVMLGVAENIDAARRAPRGVLDLPGFFDRTTRRIAGEDQTLDRYEVRIRELQAPLYPFALMRASIGGPPVLSEPLHADDVVDRLEQIARRTLEASTEATAGRLRVTELLIDRGDAIVGANPRGDAAAWQRGVVDLLDRLLPRKHPARKAGPLASLRIEPRGDWDWRLNEK
ncbi:MAG: DUF748 domain-containing protein [Planctomycetes bacterium]|nr:DUF748 domain-containing protein [Planctomycetota bacterium]